MSRFAFFLLLAAGALCVPASVVLAQTEFGVKDDLTVLGTGGTVPDPNLEIKGFSIFGSTNVLTHISTAAGNVVINGALEVSSDVYVLGISTFAGNVYVGLNGLYVGGGAPNQILKKNPGGWLEWTNMAGSGADNLGNHIATATLNMAGFGLVNVASITATGPMTASSFTATGAGLGAAQLRLANNVYISSEALAALGGGVRISSNVYIVGFSSAAKYYGDGSALTGISGDNLGNHTATLDLNMSGLQVSNISALTASSGSFSGAAGVGSAKVRLNPAVELSSTTAANYGGVYASSHVFVNGNIYAGKLFGDGTGITGITGTDNLGNHIATQTLNMAGFGLVNVASVAATGPITASSFTATGAGLGAAQLKLAGNVFISSETLASLGGGVRVSSNVYIVGFSSAAKYYGDGSALTGLSGADNLGNHTATQGLDMAGNQVMNVSTLTVSGNAFSVGGATFAVTGGNVGIRTSNPQTSLDILSSGIGDSNFTQIWRDSGGVIRASMTASGKLFADISAIAGGGDNLGSHIATNNLDMSGLQVYNVSALTASSAAFSGAAGVGAAKVRLNPNVELSSTTAANYGGVYASSHVFVNGNLYAGKLYGDGTGITGIPGADNLGSHVATTTLNMAGFGIVNLASASATGPMTASSFTATGAGLGAAQLKLANNVFISSETQAALGGGVRVSSNVYVVGFSSAAKYYGDGSALTGIAGDNLGNHTATQSLNMAGNQVSGVSALTASSASFGGAAGVGTAKVRLNPSVELSSATAANYGGVYASSHVFINGNVYGGTFYGSGLGLTGISGADNLGSHIATKTLDMAQFPVVNVSSIAMTGDGLRIGTSVNPGANGIFISTSGAIMTMGLGNGTALPNARGLGAVDLQTGRTAAAQVATGLYSVIAGGTDNTAGNYAAVGGGEGVSATGAHSVASGGKNNAVSGVFSAIGGGEDGVANGNYAVVSGGKGNNAGSMFGAVGGGVNNDASGASAVTIAGGWGNIAAGDLATIGGGYTNAASGYNATVAGGYNNAATNIEATVGGGFNNRASGDGSTIGGGYNNTAANVDATVSGGVGNTAGGQFSAISGGSNNTASGSGAAVSGGVGNTASGANSFAAGFRSSSTADGSFTWSDSEGVEVRNAGQDRTAFKNRGGMMITGATGVLPVNQGMLDVVSTGTAANVYSQVWRDGTGVVVASMTSQGTLYATLPPGAGDNLGNHLATQVLNMGGFGIVNAAGVSASGAITASSFTAAGIGLGAAQLRLANNVFISSEALASLGGGVRVSSNVYIVGFSSAAKYYGDGSALTGIAGDNLGNHTAAQALNLAGNQVMNVSTLTVNGNAFSVGGSTLAVAGGSVGIRTNSPQASLDILSSGIGDSNFTQIWRDSSGVIRASMTASGKLFADISAVAGGGDNLGNHIATNNLDMSGLQVYNVSALTASSAAFSGAAGVGAAKVRLSSNVELSSTTAANYGGLYASSHVFVNGNLYANTLYGNGAGITGLSGADNLGTHIATQTLNMAGFGIVNVASVSASGPLTASSFTATGAGLGAAQLRLANNVFVSSEAAGALGGGVRVSSNVYIVGFSSAAKYYGDGSGLTGIAGDNLGDHTATQALNMGGFQIVGASSITITGVRGLAANRVRFNPLVELSSAAPGNYGGVYSSSHVYVNGSVYANSFSGNGSNLTGINVRNFFNIALPVTVNDYVEIGNLDVPLGGHNLYVAITVSDAGFSVAKQYALPLGYNLTAGAWRDALPLSNTGPDGGNDFVLEVSVTNTIAYFRMRRTSGAAPGNALVSVEQIGSTAEVFTQTFGGGVSGSNALLPITALTQLGGNVGIGVAVPGSKFEVAGNAGISGSVTASSLTATSPLGLGSAKVRLNPAVELSSTTAANYGGVYASSHVFVNGNVYGGTFYGSGSGLTGVGGADSLGTHIATQTLNMAGFGIVNAAAVSAAGPMTASSFTATGAGLGAAQLKLAGNVFISSESAAALGGGVRVSSNVYIVGFSSAAKYYGDGSALTGIAGDNLGNHTAAQALNMAGFGIVNAAAVSAAGPMTASSFTATGAGLGSAKVRLNPNVELSSTTAANYGGVHASSHVFVNGNVYGATFYGSGAGLTGLGGNDDLGSHVATQTLVMSGFNIVGVSTLTVSSVTTTAAGVTFSTNVYILGKVGIGNSDPQQKLDVNGYVKADGFCIGSNCQLGTVGTYKGATAATYNGNRGGYATANSLCDAAFTGAHVCTNNEILFSINTGNFAAFPANTTLWISNGPPGYVANANDCQGWNSGNAGDYGPVWNKLAAGEGFGSLNKCDSVAGTPRKFACCI